MGNAMLDDAVDSDLARGMYDGKWRLTALVIRRTPNPRRFTTDYATRVLVCATAGRRLPRDWATYPTLVSAAFAPRHRHRRASGVRDPDTTHVRLCKSR